MTTAPLPASVLDKLTATSQAFRWSATLGVVRQFRAYCCNIDSDGIMGVAKEPVIYLNITPNPVCDGAAVYWSLVGSYAPGSTLTSWSVDFGDDIGSTGGSDFPNDTIEGMYLYGDAGTYIVEATITEGLGKTQTVEVEVNVVVCGEPPQVGQMYSYVSTDGQGVYYIDWATASPAWESKNTGLVGDALYVRSLVMRPGTTHLASNQHELWAATLDGVYRTTDGGGLWTKVVLSDPSNVEFDDSPAATVDELDWHHIVFDPHDTQTIYVLASKEA